MSIPQLSLDGMPVYLPTGSHYIAKKRRYPGMVKKGWVEQGPWTVPFRVRDQGLEYIHSWQDEELDHLLKQRLAHAQVPREKAPNFETEWFHVAKALDVLGEFLCLKGYILDSRSSGVSHRCYYPVGHTGECSVWRRKG